MRSTLSSIFHRLTPRTLLLQLVGNAALIVLFITWLQIPDSHAWQFFLSMLAIALLAAAFLSLHARTILRIRDAVPAQRAWLAAAVLAGCVLIAAALFSKLSALDDTTKFSERAGYWNSQLSPHLRNVFTYTRLESWQHDLASIILWWILPTLLLPIILESTARGIRALFTREIRCTYTYFTLWITTALAAWFACWSHDKLLAWRPGTSVRGELISVVFRVSAVYIIDVVLYCVVIAIVAALLAREHARRNTVPEPAADHPQPVLPH